MTNHYDTKKIFQNNYIVDTAFFIHYFSIMDNKEFIVWTKTKTQEEMDARDFKVETVLPIPTKEELDNLPKAFSLWIYVWKTYYQNGRWSCTALWTTHSMLIQNIRELQQTKPELLPDIVNKIKLWNNFIELFWESLWTRMGHDLSNKADSWDYVEKALNTAIKLWIQGKDENWGLVDYFWQNFSYKSSWRTMEDKLMAKYYLTKYPIVDVISWTNTTWSEMTKWEVKTIIHKSKSTGSHCICRVWYDEYWLRYLNSRMPNDKNKKKSVFCIKRETYFEMVNAGMANWRYWVLFDKKNAVVDLEQLKEENNALEVLKAIKTFYWKTRFWDVKISISMLWKTLRKNYPKLDKELPL